MRTIFLLVVFLGLFSVYWTNKDNYAVSKSDIKTFLAQWIYEDDNGAGTSYVSGSSPILPKAIAKSSNNNSNKNAIEKNLSKIQSVRNLPINSTQEFNYMKKSQIYDIRKRYVAQSLFAYTGYEPSNEVFGQIEDNKPWYGLKYYNCAGNVKGKKEVTLGNSEESRFINNPNLLIGIAPYSYTVDTENYKREPLCTDSKGAFIPVSAKYDPKTKTISAIYRYYSNIPYALNGINARDFGYNYVFADKYANVKFKGSTNITNSVYKFRDFIHTGGSCGLSGGCNNASPYQPALNFSAADNSKGSIIHFKLWRNAPETKSTPADINYEIAIVR